MIAVTTQLNTPGPELASLSGVHAMTDVTGFGLAGHALEMARGAGCEILINWHDVPLLGAARTLAGRGFVTGASNRNWASYGDDMKLPPDFDEASRALLTDPQTSGGLLVSCAQSSLAEVLAAFHRHGFESAVAIGSVGQKSDAPRLCVT